MEEGTIGRWLKQEGDSIKEGDVLAEIETDKATMEFQAYADGTLLKILVGDGETVALGAPIALIGEQGEQVPDAPAAEAQRRSPPRSLRPHRPRQPKSSRKPPPRTARAPAERFASARSPGAWPIAPGSMCRRWREPARARTGGSSRPTWNARSQRAAAPHRLRRHAPRTEPPSSLPAATDELRDLTPMLKAVARRMSESKTTVPHFYLSAEIDMTRAGQTRGELNEGLAAAGEKISINDLIVRACAMALIEHPQAHRSYVDGRHAYHPHANIGIAVALEDGLIVPVLRAADTRSLREIAVGSARPGYPGPRRRAASRTRSRAARSRSPTSA